MYPQKLGAYIKTHFPASVPGTDWRIVDSGAGGASITFEHWNAGLGAQPSVASVEAWTPPAPDPDEVPALHLTVKQYKQANTALTNIIDALDLAGTAADTRAKCANGFRVLRAILRASAALADT